ncbi:MAG: ATPase domain-containing protein [Scytonema sp. PMC 1070.18]|nr:ATPase domain-containing protein [Scytonema sp. PMC 1070.18]
MVKLRCSTGVSGLDEVLYGGLLPNRAYLIRGGPGAGKTTLGLHFLCAGVVKNESCLYITLGEPAEQIRANAKSLHIDAQAISFLDLSPNTEFFTQIQTYDIFSPAEVEREPTTKRILEEVQALRPKRVFLDAVTQFRYLSSDDFLFRKQVLSFIRFLLSQGATVMFSSEGSDHTPDDDLQFISDGVIHLDQSPKCRYLCVTKYRGSDFQSGFHSMRLTTTGMEVFPRLQPEMKRQEFSVQTIPSGVQELDEMLHGGLERGTVTLFTGATGVGKTTLGLQFMKEAALRGERSVIYTFEEAQETLLHRSESVNIPVSILWEQSFDLCILCGVTLEGISQQVQTKRNQESPVVLPFLLVTSRQGVRMGTRQLWQSIDELIITPIEKVELLTRVEVLLRSRHFSKQLAVANRKLLIEIEQRRCLETEIRSALQKERELSELKTRFVSMVSHEFRSPLQVILSSTQMIESYSEQLSKERKQQFFQQIKLKVKKMTQLLDDVLTIGRADLGRFKANLQFLDLTELCRNLSEEILLSMGSKHAISFVTHGKCTNAYVDENLLRHILGNLLSNAVKYSPSSSIINFTLQYANNEVIFQIQDFGLGIPLEDKEQLFSLFHRASNVKDIPGTGLGLSIVKKCIDLYGGKIEIDSELGIGTTVTVKLPTPQLLMANC